MGKNARTIIGTATGLTVAALLALWLASFPDNPPTNTPRMMDTHETPRVSTRYRNAFTVAQDSNLLSAALAVPTNSHRTGKSD